jgi:hypothetical protein
LKFRRLDSSFASGPKLLFTDVQDPTDAMNRLSEALGDRAIIPKQGRAAGHYDG